MAQSQYSVLRLMAHALASSTGSCGGSEISRGHTFLLLEGQWKVDGIREGKQVSIFRAIPSVWHFQML
jgi:hypothetical protein